MPAPVLSLLTDRDLQREAPALQSRVWDPAARGLLDDLGVPAGATVLRIGWGDHDRGMVPAGTFDVVHARFQLALLGRPAERLKTYRSLVAPGGVLIVEEPDTRTLVHEPYAPATVHLLGRVAQALKAAGGDLDAGRRLPERLRSADLQPHVRTHVVGLEAGHPYLELPLQLADHYHQRLADILGRDGLAALRRQAVAELAGPGRRGTTFTLVQAWSRVPS